MARPGLIGRILGPLERTQLRQIRSRAAGLILIREPPGDARLIKLRNLGIFGDLASPGAPHKILERELTAALENSVELGFVEELGVLGAHGFLQ